MKFTSHGVSKMDYARYTAASLFYLAIQSQRLTPARPDGF